MSKQWDSPKRIDQSLSCFFCLSFQYKYLEVDVVRECQPSLGLSQESFKFIGCIWCVIGVGGHRVCLKPHGVGSGCSAGHIHPVVPCCCLPCVRAWGQLESRGARQVLFLLTTYSCKASFLVLFFCCMFCFFSSKKLKLP